MLTFPGSRVSREPRIAASPYSGDWRSKKRPRVLREEPWCKGWPQGIHDCPSCGARFDVACPHRGRVRTTSVDHRTPLIEGGSDDRENLGALCGPCNSRKGADEGRRRRAPASRSVNAEKPTRVWRDR